MVQIKQVVGLAGSLLGLTTMLVGLTAGADALWNEHDGFQSYWEWKTGVHLSDEQADFKEVALLLVGSLVGWGAVWLSRRAFR